MDREEIINTLGRNEYNRLSEVLTKLALREDYGAKVSGVGTDFVLEFQELLNAQPLTMTDKISFAFQAFDDLPSYAALLSLTNSYGRWNKDEKAHFWELMRQRLRGRLFRPIQYILWVDFFEDAKVVNEAFQAVAVGAEHTLLERILPVTGPVPWDLKKSLLEKCILSKRLHRAMFDALYGSAFDHFGKIDKEEAAALLGMLRLDDDSEQYQRLKGELGR